MSVKTLSRVWEHSQHSGTALLMLLAIADFSDDDGRAYPAVGTLAKKCRMKLRNAQAILAVLRHSGELNVRENEGPKGTNLYRINLAALGVQSTAGVQKSAGVQPDARGGADSCAKPLQRTAPEPSLTRQEPKTTHKRPRPPVVDVAALLPGVDGQTLKDWLQVRKAKRVGPVTATVAKSMNTEATKAHLTLQKAVELCCRRGWASFDASWIAEKGRPALDADDIFRGAR